MMEQKLWPAHAVQGTWGAELHEDLKVCSSQDTLPKKLRRGH